ncbi:MAG: hypothetical protein DRJ30_00695 [Candidatus Methanomethylicota archaeon]|nr:MAG: hypothetical protein DRJ30_00695 [Candidatus Verstraetearchaeota archaeon]
MVTAIKEYRCKRCGAPLKITPETIVAICGYCGYPNWISHVEEQILIIPSLSRDEVKFSFKKRISEDFDLRKIKDKIKIVTVDGAYIPFYFYTVRAEAYYEGWRVETVAVKRGKRTILETRRKMVRDRICSTLKISILARRGAEDFSIKELTDYYRYANPETVDIMQIDWSKVKLPILKTEIPVDEADILARDKAMNIMREKAKSKVSELTKFICRAKILERSPLTLLPYWYVIYSYRGAQYRAAYAGWDRHLLTAQEPIMPYHRILYFIGSVAGCLISSLGMVFSHHISTLLLSLIIGGGISFYFGDRLVSDVRIERGV